MGSIDLKAVLLAAVICISATTGIGVAGSWFDEQRTLLAIALALGVGFHGWRPQRSVGADRLMLLAAAVLAVGLASVLAAQRPLAAAGEWAILALLALLVCRGDTDVARLAPTAAVLATAIAATYSMGVLANLSAAFAIGGAIGSDAFLVGFSNPRFPAQLQALSLPLLPLALTMARRRMARLAISLVFAVWWMCAIGSGSRTAWLALIAASAVVMLGSASGLQWLRAQALHALAGAALFVLLFLAVPAYLGMPIGVETGRLQDAASIVARIELAKLALSMIVAHPLLGVGPMHFAYIDNGLGAHPHNFWLQLAAEWGLPVCLTVLAMALVLLWRTWQVARRQAQDAEAGLLPVCLLAALVAWFVGTQFDGYMVVPTSQVASALVLMLCVSLVRAHGGFGIDQPRLPAAVTRVLGYAPALVVATAIAILAWLPFTSFGQPTQREMLWRAENPTKSFWPRFWQQGWIGPDADPTAR